MDPSKIVRLVIFFLFVTWLLWLIGCAPAETQDDLPSLPPPKEQAAPTPEPPRVFRAPLGFVNDFGDILDTASEHELETRLSRFRDDRKVDFKIVTVLSTGPESIDDYSLEMAKEWKVGSENGGLLLLVSIDYREWRIQIDRKLEEVMTNEEVRQIGELMVPEFKRKQYTAGIRKCVDTMIGSLTKKLDGKAISR